MRRRFAAVALAALTGGCAALGAGVPPVSLRGEAAAGERFARRACAGCHALGPQGESPNRPAPPFRILAARAPGAALEARLGAISAQGHVQMPPIYMTPSEIRAVAAYMRAAARPGA